MRHLEQGRNAEHLGELGANTGEHRVGEKDIPLDLLGEVFDGARVGQAELRPALIE
jgi:hypothetical protein